MKKEYMKKEYMKPTTRTVELKQRTMILTESSDAYGMERNLQNETVEEAW